MKRKRSVENKIYVKVVGLKVRLVEDKKIRKVIGHTRNILFWRGRGNMSLAHYMEGKFAFYLGLHEISK